ncbi:NAD(P)/FAD-dependent oxidoreductase [Geminicoccus roseus]|uniref:NAD(P)/FAD-dependent oxidoreductase n=1 Tax=Geminicoccus roseus TaxID=404900 RepID=UPI000425B591|nr:FAD-binding oxidoreductase [Geminicoccus roseus]
MGPVVDPVDPNEKLPEQVDVVVIGGGIIGVSAAMFLAERGVSVALCEKGHIAGEQSSRNWGWVRKMGRDPRELPLIIESLKIWPTLNQKTEAETGFKVTGIMYGARSEAEMAKHEEWLQYSRPYQLDTKAIGKAEFDELMPGSDGGFVGALYTASDGRAEPQKAGPAIAKAAQRMGAHVFTECAVRTIERQGGKVSGVVTEKGRIRCSTVVLAGGSWSSLFAGNLGIRLPQLSVINSVMRTAPLEGAPEHALWDKAWAFRKRLDGGYTIADGSTNVHELVPNSFRFFKDFLPAMKLEWRSYGLQMNGRFMTEAGWPKTWSGDQVTPFEKIRVNDPAPVEKVTKTALAKLKAAFPAFANAKIVQQWAGRIDVTPDIVPVISHVDSVPGFFIATGFSGHGFGIGPGAGKLIADMVMGKDPVVDPTEFRLSRFLDGTVPRPMGHA